MVTRLIETGELKTNLWSQLTLNNKEGPSFYYNDETDAFSLMLAPRSGRIITHYLDEHVALLYRHEDREVVGIRVESFERSFLPLYVELQKAWKLSDTRVELENLADLKLDFQIRVHKVARELSAITSSLVQESGLNLQPVPA